MDQICANIPEEFFDIKWLKIISNFQPTREHKAHIGQLFELSYVNQHALYNTHIVKAWDLYPFPFQQHTTLE